MFRLTGRRLSDKRPGYYLTMLGIALLAVSLIPAAGGSEAVSSDIIIEITGTPDTRFSARWELIRADGGRQVIKEQGRLPARHHFRGAAMAAELTVLDDGFLQLEIHKGGNHSRFSTGGAGSRLSVSVH